MTRLRTLRRGLGPGLAAAVGGAILTALTVVVASRWTVSDGVDRAASSDAVAAARHDAALLAIARAATALGSPVGITIMTVLGLTATVLRRRWAAAVVVVAVPVITSLVGQALKHAVGRPRPHVDSPLATALGFSFPSGHSSGIAAMMTLCVASLWQPREQGVHARRARAAASAAVVALAVCVAASRVLLGVHYPTDVVAGLALGVLVANTALLLASYGARRARSRASPGPREPGAP